MPENVLDMAQRRVNLKRVGSTKGGEWQGPCPGCGGEDRFHAWPQENDGQGSYWCRQCGKAGDAIQFLRDFEGLSFQDACERLGREIPRDMPGQAPRAPKPRPATWEPPATEGIQPQAWREKALALVAWAHENLMQSRGDGVMECRAFLAERGFDEIDAQHYRLGWNPKDLFRPRELWGLPTELKDDGQKKRLWIPGGLVIPLLRYDTEDLIEVLRVRIRRPEGEPRYYALPGSDMRCMIWRGNPRACVVVESELDGYLLDKHTGDMGSIIALGNSSRKPDEAAHKILERTSKILVALDFDDAGQKALVWWLEHYRQAAHWPVPRGKDPGDAYQEGVDLREWVLSGLPRAWQETHRSGA